MRSVSWREPSLASPLESMRALSIHRFLFRFALGGANVFAWVFVFQYFYLVEPDIIHGLARTALLYALSQTITCLLSPYTARLLRRGARRVLLIATIMAASSFVILGATFEGFWGGAYASTALVVFACVLGLYRALYWIPYEIEAAATGKAKGSVFAEFPIALAPLFGAGCIVVLPYGAVWLLYVGAAFIVLAALPVSYLRDVHEGFSWGYRETFRQLIDPANRPIVGRSVLEGIAGAALLLFWPLAVFLFSGWSYGMLGAVLSITFVVAVLARSFVRKGIRKVGLHSSDLVNVVLAVSPWVFRVVVGTPLGAVFIDSYFYTTTPRRIGLDPLTFEQTADAGSYIDEYTALKEMGLALGRIALCVIGTLAALLISLPAAFTVVFLCAAAASAVIALRPR